MKITVKTLDSRTGEFDLSDETTVQQLKDMIVEKMSIPLDRQRLIFHGRPLKDNRKLTEYGVKDGDVIHLVPTAPPTVPPTAAEQMQQEASEGQTSQQDMDTTPTAQDTTASDTAAEVPPPSEQPTAPPPEPEVHSGPTLFTGSSPFPPESATFSGPTPQQRRHDQEHRWEEQERRLQKRTRRQAVDVYRHMKSARKCLKFARKILDRYDRAEAHRAALKKAKEEEGKAEGEEQTEERTEEQTEERTEEQTDEQTEEMMDTQEPDTQEPDKLEYVDTVDIDDKNAELPPLKDSMFADMLEEIQVLQARARPLIDEYEKLVREEHSLQGENSLHAQRVTITVKDFNYYIGHAYASSSQLQVAMHLDPPRFIKIVPPRRSEMRRVLHQLQNEAREEAVQEQEQEQAQAQA